MLLENNLVVRYLGGSFRREFPDTLTNRPGLAPGSAIVFSLRAPTKLSWRVEIGAVGQSEINRKVYLRRHLPGWQFLRRCTAWYFVLRPRYARTEWVLPPERLKVREG